MNMKKFEGANSYRSGNSGNNQDNKKKQENFSFI